MPRTVFLGTGHYVPSKLVTNDDLAALMDTSDEWIRQRTGIEQRYFVDFETEPMGASDLGTRAAEQAMAAAGVGPGDIDMIVNATLSPDHPFPGDGVFVQRNLDIPAGVPCLDVRNQCTGFLYSLGVSDALIRSGQYQRILLVGAEVHSSGLNFTDAGRDVGVIFGDGGAAVVLGASDDEGRGVLKTDLYADGRHAESLWIKYPGSRYSPRGTKEMLDDPGWYPEMQGKMVFKEAVSKLPGVITQALAACDLTVADVDWLIPHQANLRINDAVSQRLGIDPAKVVNNIQRYGNTTAASIPLALDEAVRDGRVKPGDLIVFAAFGAGFTWAVSIVRW